MNKLLTVTALVTLLATPAFAQCAQFTDPRYEIACGNAWAPLAQLRYERLRRLEYQASHPPTKAENDESIRRVEEMGRRYHEEQNR